MLRGYASYMGGALTHLLLTALLYPMEALIAPEAGLNCAFVGDALATGIFRDRRPAGGAAAGATTATRLVERFDIEHFSDFSAK